MNTLKTCSTIAAEAMEEKRRAMRKAWIGKGIVDLQYGNVFITTKELQVVDLYDLWDIRIYIYRSDFKGQKEMWEGYFSKIK